MSIAEKSVISAENSQAIFENQQKVFDKGYEEGYNIGKSECNGLKYANGTVEFVDADNCIFYHNLGEIPRFLFIWTDVPEERSNACLGISYSSIMPLNLNAVFEDRTTYTEPNHLSNYPNTLKELTDTYAVIAPRQISYKILTGVTYNWLVIE